MSRDVQISSTFRYEEAEMVSQQKVGERERKLRVKGEQKGSWLVGREKRASSERLCDPGGEVEKIAGAQSSPYFQLPSFPGAVPVSAHPENKFTPS